MKENYSNLTFDFFQHSLQSVGITYVKIGHIFGVLLQEISLPLKFYIANGQKDFSRALKWGIACLCISYTFGDRAKSLKISIFKFSQFCKNSQRAH